MRKQGAGSDIFIADSDVLYDLTMKSLILAQDER